MLEFIDAISETSLDNYLPQTAFSSEEDNLIVKQRNKELIQEINSFIQEG